MINKMKLVYGLKKMLTALLRRKKSRPSSGGFSGKGRMLDFRQNCIVKVQYSNNLDAHRVQLEKYLTREGTERDGSRARLYGTELEEYRQNMVDKNFRIFLSPQSDKTDLAKLADEFVRRLEFQTGYKFYWQAANHYNTAHPHTHLLINGVDRNGRKIILPKDMRIALRAERRALRGIT